MAWSLSGSESQKQRSSPRRPFCKITRFYHFAAAGPARPPPNSSRASAPTYTQPRASTTTSHVLSGQRGGLQQATAPARRRHWHVGPARAPRACGRASSRSVWMASGWRGHRPLAVSLLELSFLPFPFGIRNLSILKPYTLPFGF